MSTWGPDILGAGFERLDLPLGSDDEGPLLATLVRSLPDERGLWQRLIRREREFEHLDILYVHGWSDYFFQAPLARFFTERGARFFALDLRKCGRSFREWQTQGYISNLEAYDLEVDLAIDVIRGGVGVRGGRASGGGTAGDTPDSGGVSAGGADGPARRLVLLGHSTGGLVLSLWASRHPGVAEALVLNSPWLELQLTGAGRKALAPMVNLRAKFSPHELALPQLDQGFYVRAQREAAGPNDLALIDLKLRPETSLPIRAGWFKAILDGHAQIAQGIDVAMPVCTLLSRRSVLSVKWSDEMLRADTVLDVEAVAHAALKLGDAVTIEWLDGALHDVFLSEQHVRAEAYERLRGWLTGWQAALSRPR